MRETQVSDVADLPVGVLAQAALIAESLLDRPGVTEDTKELLADRRKVFLDELVGRGAIPGYSFV